MRNWLLKSLLIFVMSMVFPTRVGSLFLIGSLYVLFCPMFVLNQCVLVSDTGLYCQFLGRQYNTLLLQNSNSIRRLNSVLANFNIAD